MAVVGFKQLLLAVAILVVGNNYAQITQGKITFERKTNLFKKFDDKNIQEFLKDNKVKVDKFELFFNDSTCAFKPVALEVVDELSWTTNKNSVYQNLSNKERMTVMDLWGNLVFIKDSISPRAWKITDNSRNIAGYNCRKAIYQKDDSTRIYAWFSVDLVPSIGPELFSGLPGAILGLATEDGGVIYFATEVKAMNVPAETFNYKAGKNEIYTVEKIRKELESKFASQPWGKRVLEDMFRWY